MKWWEVSAARAAWITEHWINSALIYPLIHKSARDRPESILKVETLRRVSYGRRVIRISLLLAWDPRTIANRFFMFYGGTCHAIDHGENVKICFQKLQFIFSYKCRQDCSFGICVESYCIQVCCWSKSGFWRKKSSLMPEVVIVWESHVQFIHLFEWRLVLMESSTGSSSNEKNSNVNNLDVLILPVDSSCNKGKTGTNQNLNKLKRPPSHNIRQCSCPVSNSI